MKIIVRTELINQFMQKYRLTKAGFCKMCKIGTKTLNDILLDRAEVKVTVLFKIAQVMGISLQDLAVM